jgi:hypothetical protein
MVRLNSHQLRKLVLLALLSVGLSSNRSNPKFCPGLWHLDGY